MALISNRFAAAGALAAALSLSTTPAAALDLPTPAPHSVAAYDGKADTLNHSRWRRHRGIDAGDVLAGVLVIGGIAAIASAANKNKRERDYRYRDYPVRDRDYRGDEYRYRNDSRGYQQSGGGIDRAVDMCVSEVQRGNDRVDVVDGANRTGDGWRVSGQLARGGVFSCWIDNQGRIRDIDIGDSYGYGERDDASQYGYSDEAPNYDGREYGASVPDRQYDDETYARARAEQRAQAVPSGWENSPPIDGDLAESSYASAN